MAPRWKFKGAEAKALEEPISKSVSQLVSSLMESEAIGLLTDCNALLPAGPEQAELLNRACIGRAIITAEKHKQWFQLFMEEAFYLFHALKCIRFINNGLTLNEEDAWRYMKSGNGRFHVTYKAYSHLRIKNWVVRSGLQYGVDFVAYRHHPSLVHSEYAVLVSSGDGGGLDGRLRMWSDVHCTVRLCGSVAKTLLVLHVSKSRHGADEESPASLENYEVHEQTVARWSPKQCRENQTANVTQ